MIELKQIFVWLKNIICRRFFQKETLNFRTRDKISQLESQVHLLSTQVRDGESNGGLTRIKPQVIDHLQSLIAEVQSGVETTPSLSSGEETSGDTATTDSRSIEL